MFRLVTTVASLAPLAAAAAAARGPAVVTSSARNSFATMARGGASAIEFETLATPAPGTPFHYAFPVHDLNAAKEFYGSVLGCIEGRSSEKVQYCRIIGSARLLHGRGMHACVRRNGVILSLFLWRCSFHT
jgi:hypothetical protein